MKTYRIGIAGYGNLGRGAELALQSQPDLRLAAVFTRRDPGALRILTPGVPVYPLADAAAHVNEIDVLLLCGGSATDLPDQGPQLAKLYTTVDSFDTHAHIPEYFSAVDAAAKDGGHLSLISVGWDPGLFSLLRCYAASVLPQGESYTFWGRGVSQGHSDAIRRLPGVADARQYTVPVQEAVDAVRRGENPCLTTREKHTRECFVVLKEGADPAAVEKAIVEMPNYFADYDTTVHFVSQEELDRDHAGLPHGGFVLRSGATGKNAEHKHLIEFALHLDSNPEFTSSVLVAYARAAAKMAAEGQTGARSVLDVPPAYLSPLSGAELRRTLL